MAVMEVNLLVQVKERDGERTRSIHLSCPAHGNLAAMQLDGSKELSGSY
jgi:hypothetical protein